MRTISESKFEKPSGDGSRTTQGCPSLQARLYQLATYDGTIYNVRKVLEKIGHLCDYVLWDEAWIGYNAFHPLFEDHSPMRLPPLGPEMAGLFSTQSVHKQAPDFRSLIESQPRRAHPRAAALHQPSASMNRS